MRIHKRTNLLRLSALLLSLTVVVAQAATLTAFATLPADTFAPGPAPAHQAGAAPSSFQEQQPVQGFSALLKGDKGTYFVLSDNGFGQRGNSAGYLLSIYHIQPDFRTAAGGTGQIRIKDIIHLSDPQHHLPYPATREQDRLLTGADLDPESFQRVSDGSFWIGEEFNPSLLHFSAAGVLLAPPFTLTGLVSVDNPSGEQPTLPRSRGFEGMALSVDGRRLFPMLEGALDDSGPGLNIYSFDIRTERFLNTHARQPDYRYRLDEGATAIGDFTMYSETAGLVIERDSQQGENARIKKIYQIDFEQLDSDGFLRKTQVADLLDIKDPYDLNQDGNEHFAFPFWTIEGLLVLNHTTLGIVNDNNYPLGHSVSGETDNTEFILLEVDPLWDLTSDYNQKNN